MGMRLPCLLLCWLGQFPVPWRQFGHLRRTSRKNRLKGRAVRLDTAFYLKVYLLHHRINVTNNPPPTKDVLPAAHPLISVSCCQNPALIPSKAFVSQPGKSVPQVCGNLIVKRRQLHKTRRVHLALHHLIDAFHGIAGKEVVLFLSM